MPSDAMKPGLRAALRMHEIGKASPYQLFFAGKGKSGASFGFMQGDLAAGQTVARDTFRRAMADAGMAVPTIDALLQKLSVHLIGNPLSAPQTAAVNAALLAGRIHVDAMDEQILQAVYGDLDTCIARAKASHRSMNGEAQIYAALWINMTGAPTKLLTWLGGGDPELSHPIPPAGPVVDGAGMRGYLRATRYYTENPQNFAHLQESVDAGLAAMPPGAGVA